MLCFASTINLVKLPGNEQAGNVNSILNGAWNLTMNYLHKLNGNFVLDQCRLKVSASYEGKRRRYISSGN